MIFNLSGGGGAGLTRWISNDTAVVPTGTYATSEYYDTDFGVKISYVQGGDVMVTMRGASADYPNIQYTLPSNTSAGATLTNSDYEWASGNPTGGLYTCVISGLTESVTMGITMNNRSSESSEFQDIYAQISLTED